MKRLYKLYEDWNMKIAHKSETVLFDEIDIAEVFTAANMEFMKICAVKDIQGTILNAVKLDDGCLFNFDGDNIVEPVEAELVIG